MELANEPQKRPNKTKQNPKPNHLENNGGSSGVVGVFYCVLWRKCQWKPQI